MAYPPSTKTSPMGKDYMYRRVHNRTFDFTTDPANGSSIRNATLDERQRIHDERVMEKKEREANKQANLLQLKKREQAEERLRIRARDNQLDTLWNDPIAVVQSLRERCRQKPQLFINMFPPKSTRSMGLLELEDIERGLSMMGFNLTQQKIQMVLTILGIGSLLNRGKAIPLSQLKTAILNKNLEEHHEQSIWMARGGGGKLKSTYEGRSKDNRGDPAFEKLREREERKNLERENERRSSTMNISMSDNLRTMLRKLGDRFSSVRRAFRSMDRDKSGSLTRLELKNILDTFCLEIEGHEFDELMTFFDVDGDGLISYEEFLRVVKDEIQPQLKHQKDATTDVTPTKPGSHDFRSSNRPKRHFTTTYSSSYTKPGFLPVKSLDELKIYQDFLSKIATEMGNVREAFMSIDIHREGYITKDELRAVLDNFSFKMNKHQFDAIVNLLDQNNDGKISYEEFLNQVRYCDDENQTEEEAALMAQMMEYDQTPEAKKKLQIMKNRAKKVTSYEFLMEKIWERHDSMHSAFKKMDKDNSGSLSAAELKEMLDSYCYKVPDAVFADMLELFDADGDGEISYHEFMAQVKRAVEPSGYTEGIGDDSASPKNTRRSVANALEYEDPEGASRMASFHNAAALRSKIEQSSNAFKNICAKIYTSYGSMRSAFMSMDKDKSGYLDPDELRSVFEGTGYNITDGVFAEILDHFDENGDGCINYQEFLSKLKEIMEPTETGGVGHALSNKADNRQRGRVHGGAVDKSLSVRKGNSVGAALRFICEKIHEKWENIRKSFMMLDWDKSGTISPDEFRAVLDDCCYTVSDDVFMQLIDIFDSDGDGEISYNELLEQMQKVIAGDMSDLERAKQRRKEREMGADPSIRKRREMTSKNFPGIADSWSDGNGDSVSGGGKYSRFDDKLDHVPNLGHGHMHICKTIEAKYAVIKDALERMDYNKRGFVACKELQASVETFCGKVNPILWDDIVLFFDSSRTGLVEYRKFIEEVRQLVKGKYGDDSNASPSTLRDGFNSNGANSVVSHVNMQNSNHINKVGSALGMGSHGTSDVNASMRFLCEKIYEKFPTIRSAFMTMDKDRGGTIGKAELKNILDDCCYHVPDTTFEACYKLFDTDGDGEISYQEFMDQVKRIVEPGDNNAGGLSTILVNDDRKKRNNGTKGVADLYKKGDLLGPSHSANEALIFLQQKLSTQTDSVRTAFRLFDYDQTGSISKDELRRVIDNYCYKMDDAEFDKLMGIIDTTRDGKVSYEEFMEALGAAIIPMGPHANRRQSAQHDNAQKMKSSSIVFG